MKDYNFKDSNKKNMHGASSDAAENKSQKSDFILTIAFIVIILGIFTASIAARDVSFSENENRPLAQFPEVNAKSISDGQFEKGFESYSQDHVVFRDRFMRIKTFADIMMAKRDNGNVYFGKDGYLFAIEKIDSTGLEKNIKALNIFADAVSEKTSAGIDIMIVPTATEILESKLPVNAPVPDQGAALSLIARNIRKAEVINVYDVMKAHADEYIYYKTDHHWTTLGAAYAYAAYAEKAGLRGESAGAYDGIAEYDIVEVSKDFKGTNYSKAMLALGGLDRIDRFEKKEESRNLSLIQVDAQGNITKELAGLYDESYLSKRDQYSYFLAGNSPLTLITGKKSKNIEIDKQIENCRGDKNLLIIKDSFANCFVPFLTENFDNILIVDLRYYRGNLLKLVENYSAERILILYNILNFSRDANILRLAQ